MSFTSVSFWLVFPCLFMVYWIIPSKWVIIRKIFLIIISYALYMNFKPAFALVLFGVTLVTYWGGAAFGVKS